MDRFRDYHPTTMAGKFIFGLVGFGLSGVLSFLIAWLLLSGPISWLADILIGERQILQRLLIAILLIALGFTVWGGLLGAINGWLMTRVDILGPRRRYLWSGVLAYAIAQTVLIPIFILLTSLLAVINNNIDVLLQRVTSLFAIYGLIYGLVVGLIFGIASIGLIRSWRVILASVLGHALGGALLGLLLNLSQRTSGAGHLSLWDGIIISLCFFGIAGGFLAIVFAWIESQRESRGDVPTKVGRFWKWTGAIIGILLLLFLGSNLYRIYQFAQIRQGSLSSTIPSKTTGVAWSSAEALADLIALPDQYDLAGNGEFPASLVWQHVQDGASTIYLTSLASPTTDDWISVSTGNNEAFDPAIAIDPSGNQHVIYVEIQDGQDVILYTRCVGTSCAEPVLLSDRTEDACTSADAGTPAIAIDGAGRVMAVWRSGETLAYATWQDRNSAADATSGCVPTASPAGIPQVAAVSADAFLLAYEHMDGGQIDFLRYAHPQWEGSAVSSVSGTDPTLYQDPDGNVHSAWCGTDGQVMYRSLANPAPTPVTGTDHCTGRPTMAIGADGQLQLVWPADSVVNNSGNLVPGSFLLTSIQTADAWSSPTLVSPDNASAPAQAAQSTDSEVQLIWADQGTGRLQWAAKSDYQCPESPDSAVVQAILDVFRSGKYRPVNESIPYCQNRFERLLFLPTAPPTLQIPSPPYGGFDTVDAAVQSANYEVLFATMEYMADVERDSPGFRLADTVTNLYRRVSANPSRYPRGMTVRILLGNYPEMSNFEWGSQIWHVMQDLVEAGLPTMEDPEIGWLVQVANFDGQLPHSHTKFLVIDGRIAISAGFNYSYLHLGEDHPSGLGVSLVDLGLMMTGPVAQASLTAYDDMWDGADQLRCNTLDPLLDLWGLACNFDTAVADHTPEVQQYYIPAEGAQDAGFSMFRNIKYHESDDAVAAALRSAESSLDIFEVNFSLELYCSLAIVVEDICNFDQAKEYMVAMVDAIEQNQVRTRILITDVNMNGIENTVASQILLEELARRGLEDLVEIHFYTGRMHAKAVLIDEDFLIVGSQNFHYSAWGEAPFTLAEYNLGTDSPEAIRQFQETFEYYWQNSVPYDPESGLRFDN